MQDVVDHPGDFGIGNVADRCYTGDDLNFSGGGTICALLTSAYEVTLSQYLMLAFFMALVLGLGPDLPQGSLQDATRLQSASVAPEARQTLTSAGTTPCG